MPEETIPSDVQRLVIAARSVAFGELRDLALAAQKDETTLAIRELTSAAEAFATRVAWEVEETK